VGKHFLEAGQRRAGQRQKAIMEEVGKIKADDHKGRGGQRRAEEGRGGQGQR
jgi:hypothetical protein